MEEQAEGLLKCIQQGFNSETKNFPCKIRVYKKQTYRQKIVFIYNHI